MIRKIDRLKLSILLIGVVVSILLIAVSAVFANAYGARRAGDDAAALHRAETMLASAAIVRTQVGQVALVATYIANQPGEDAGAADVARAEATAALADYEEVGALYAESYALEGSETAALITAYQASAEELLAAIDRGELETANALLDSSLNPAYSEVIANVATDRDSTVNDLAAAQTVVGRISEISRFLVAFLIPSAAILLYRWAAKRERTQADLETRLEAQRALNKAKDEFVASVSHELRTPLTSIYGFAQLLAEGGYQDPNTTSELVELIRGEADELSRMVEDLLTAARADAGALAFHLQDFEASEAVDRALAPLLKGGVALDLDVQPAQIHADDFRFRQIIRNLVSNARRYGAEPIGVRGVDLGTGYRVTVHDRGEGVASHVSDRLFQRFVHQGHQPLLVGSVGLGLSIVRILAEGMGGGVSYERAEGETRFVVMIPLAGEAGGALPEQLAS